MGRTYAGILGPIAFAVVVARQLGGGSLEATLKGACLSLFLFGALGYLAGRLAEWTVREAVRFQLTADLTADDGSEN